MNMICRIIPVLSLLLVLASCGGSNTKNVDTNQNGVNNSAPQEVTKDSVSLNELYLSLPVIELPLAFDMGLLERFDDYKHLNERDYHRLTDIHDIQSYYDNSLRIARLPSKNNMRFIITKYQSPTGDQIMELYSLSVDLSTKDRLQIFSIEELEGGNAIVQTFEIDKDFRIKVSKHVSGILIEQLTYMPTRVRVFEELRDGKTTTVAFDSYDGQTYIVETFIWDYNSSGGLIKKNRSVANYRFTENGFMKVEKDGSKSADIEMTISPQTYQSAPEKVSLKITNKTSSTIQYGADYEIEKLVNGQWIKQEFPEGIAFIAIMYMLEPGKSETYDIYLYPDKIKYESGKYRVKKNVLAVEGSTPYYAEFSFPN